MANKCCITVAFILLMSGRFFVKSSLLFDFALHSNLINKTIDNSYLYINDWALEATPTSIGKCGQFQ